MQPIKPFYNSLIIRANVIVILTVVIAVITALIQPEVVNLLPPWLVAAGPVLLAILNIILRAISPAEPITNYAAQRTTRRGA